VYPSHGFLPGINRKRKTYCSFPLPGLVSAVCGTTQSMPKSGNYEVFRLNRHWLWVEFVFPHESAIVSKTRSKRNAGG
jgi:hypothetical protein